MATYKSAEITAKEASSGEKYDARTNAGVVKVAEFDGTGLTGATPVLEAVELPQGATVLYGSLWTSAAAGTGATFSANGTNIGSAITTTGAVAADNSGIGDAAVVVGQDGLVKLTFTGTVTGTPTVKGYVYYIVDAT
jgi:hypothetical protein